MLVAMTDQWFALKFSKKFFFTSHWVYLTLAIGLSGCKAQVLESYQRLMNKVASYTDDYLVINKSRMSCLDQYKLMISLLEKYREVDPDQKLGNYRLEGEETLAPILRQYENGPMGMPETFEEANQLVKKVEYLAPNFFSRCLDKTTMVRQSCLKRYGKDDYQLWNCIGTGETILSAQAIKNSPAFVLFDEVEKKRIEEELDLTFDGLPPRQNLLDN
jgi:hypothetical protein